MTFYFWFYIHLHLFNSFSTLSPISGLDFPLFDSQKQHQPQFVGSLENLSDGQLFVFLSLSPNCTRNNPGWNQLMTMWKGSRWWEMSPVDGEGPGLGLKLTFTNKSSLVNIVTTAGEGKEDPKGQPPPIRGHYVASVTNERSASDHCLCKLSISCDK